MPCAIVRPLAKGSLSVVQLLPSYKKLRLPPCESFAQLDVPTICPLLLMSSGLVNLLLPNPPAGLLLGSENVV